jgi:hypothetical protein
MDAAVPSSSDKAQLHVARTATRNQKNRYIAPNVDNCLSQKEDAYCHLKDDKLQDVEARNQEILNVGSLGTEEQLSTGGTARS